MTLRELKVRKRQSYEEMAGRFVAEVSYEGSGGTISMPLGPDISEKLMEFLAPMLARFGSEAANEIASSVLSVVEDSKAVTLPESSSAA